MKAKAIVCAIAAFSMGGSGAAFAQNDKDMRADRAGQVERGERPAVDRSQPRPQTREQRQWQRVNGGDRDTSGRAPVFEKDGRDGRDGRRDDDRRYDRRDDRRDDGRYDRRGDGRYDNRGDARYDHRGRGAGPNHNFYRGGRLPPEWRSRQYVVDDWRGHRLSAPPRGYQWIQTGGDYVLVAIATGIIASILLSQ